ncbi:MAG: hypothetical protein ABIS03_09280 [Gemmatimonadaceae bacterium]
MLQQNVPSAAPVLTPGQIVIEGAPIAGPSDIYQAFRAQRRELGRQLETLEGSRNDLSQELQDPMVTGASRAGLEKRITSVDERITGLERQITEADAQVARSAAIPGATVEPPSPRRDGPPEEAYVIGTIFMVIVLLPMSIAFARRIWRRSAKVVTTIPREMSERLMRVEQTVESSAIEIERIGEGQRFMTRLFSENPATLPLSLPDPSHHAAALHAGKPGDIRP